MMKLTDLVFTDINTLLRNVNPHKALERGRGRGRESGSESESESECDSDSDSNPEDVIQRHIESTESVRNLVIETIRRQNDIIPDILALNERFHLLKVKDPMSVERDRVVRSLSSFFLFLFFDFSLSYSLTSYCPLFCSILISIVFLGFILFLFRLFCFHLFCLIFFFLCFPLFDFILLCFILFCSISYYSVLFYYVLINGFCFFYYFIP